MMQHQDNLREGQQELLDCAGRDFLFGDTPFRALVRDMATLENEAYDLSPNDDDEVTLTALQSAFPTLPRIGESFVDSTGVTYRIKAIRRPPNHITIKFHCQITYP